MKKRNHAKVYASQEVQGIKKSEPSIKSIVVYFSHSGNTEKIAEAIAEKTNSDVFEIETVEEYPSDYNTVVDLAKKEQNKQARPELSGQITSLADYDLIYLGYPNWWGDMPMAVYSFLDQYDLSNKSIAPFCTHGGSGLSATDKKIQNEEKQATVLEGLALRVSGRNNSSKTIEKWLGRLK